MLLNILLILYAIFMITCIIILALFTFRELKRYLDETI